MEKTFANATLFSATVLAVFMIMIPVNHLSAQNEIKLDEKEKVHKVKIENLSISSNSFSFVVDGGSVPVHMDASTTIFYGTGEETSVASLYDSANVYVFGQYDPSTKSIPAKKIVLRNKRVTERTSLSKAQLEAAQGTSSPFQALGFLVP